MRKNYFFIACAVLALTNEGIAQHNKYDEDVAYQKTLVLDVPSSKEYALSQFEKLYKLDKNYSYQTIRTTTDVTGMSHERLQQFYKGIKIEFGVFIIHSKEGKVVSVNGELYNASSTSTNPVLTKESGFSVAVNETNAVKYLWEDPEQAKLMEYVKPSGELVLFPIVKTGEVRLAYKYDIYAVEPILREEIFVDAISGAILFRNPIINVLTV